MNKEYNLKIAQSMCAAIEAAMHGDFHVTLGGSCLYRGESKKDMDVYLYPHNFNKRDEYIVKWDKDKLVRAITILRALGFNLGDMTSDNYQGIACVLIMEHPEWGRVDFFFVDRIEIDLLELNSVLR